MYVAEGFPGQRMVVVPRPALATALAAPITRRLVVTAAGFFPNAADHLRIRKTGIPDGIVILCVDGGGWVSLGGDRVRVGSGSVVVIPPGAAHEYGALPHRPWTIWWCHVRGSDAPELLSAVASPTRSVVPLRDPEGAVPLAMRIVGELERGTSPGHLVGSAGMAWNLLTRLATDRLMRDRTEPLERAMGYLADTLETTVRVPDLAALVGLSTSHLSSLFRRATGGGVLAYQTALRVERACKLLDTTRLPVGEIAASLGYRDPLYFSRLFRQHRGVSPQQYRNRPRGAVSDVG